MRWPIVLHRGGGDRVHPALLLALALIGLLAVAVPAMIVASAPDVRPHKRLAKVVAPQRVIPPAELPPVEPVIFQDLSPEDAREYNATIPFSTVPNPAARPFVYAGTPEQLERATQCLTTAVLYEAGDDTVGQRAVAQVILNRARHPAFPETICGVVFQGSERRTGCQFTFTCDGALLRNHWSDAAWQRARDTAALALNGGVFKPVGYSTHYHTDWVVPYWSASLDKVASVDTHLFFRWTGWWGTPPAFRRTISADEPVIAQLAAISAAHQLGLSEAQAAAAAGDATISGDLPAPLASDPNAFLLTLDPGVPGDALAVFAQRLCGDRTFCKVMVWGDKAKTPTTLPVDQDQVAAMSFSYLRDRSRAFEKTLWNCGVYQRTEAAQCMKVQVLTTAPPVVPTILKSGDIPVTGEAVPDLAGVRRKDDPAAKPTPQVTATPKPKKWQPPKNWGNIRPNGAKSGW